MLVGEWLVYVVLFVRFLLRKFLCKFIQGVIKRHGVEFFGEEEVLGPMLPEALRDGISQRTAPISHLRAIEIGVFAGDSSLYLLTQCNLFGVRLELHLVDPWEDSEREFESMKGFAYLKTPEYFERLKEILNGTRQEFPAGDAPADATGGSDDPKASSASPEEAPSLLSPASVASLDAASLAALDQGGFTSQGKKTEFDISDFRDMHDGFYVEKQKQTIKETGFATGDVVLADLLSKLKTIPTVGGAGLCLLDYAVGEVVGSGCRAGEDPQDGENEERLAAWKNSIAAELLEQQSSQESSGRGGSSSKRTAIPAVVRAAFGRSGDDFRGGGSGGRGRVHKVFVHRAYSDAAHRHYFSPSSPRGGPSPSPTTPAPPALTFHLAFIDGDHSFRGVSTDLSLYAPLTKFALSGHDFTIHAFPGIPTALHVLLSNATSSSGSEGESGRKSESIGTPAQDGGLRMEEKSLYARAGWRFEENIFLDSDSTWWLRCRTGGCDVRG